jgi:hypothetical protein
LPKSYFFRLGTDPAGGEERIRESGEERCTESFHYLNAAPLNMNLHSHIWELTGSLLALYVR